jgi:hypothetical protein
VNEKPCVVQIDGVGTDPGCPGFVRTTLPNAILTPRIERSAVMLQTKRGKLFLVAVMLLVLIVFAQIRQASRGELYFPVTPGFDSYNSSGTQNQDWNQSTPGGNIGGTRDCFYYNDPSSGSSVMTGC